MNEFQKVIVIAVSYFPEDNPSEGGPYIIYDITNIII